MCDIMIYNANTKHVCLYITKERLSCLSVYAAHTFAFGPSRFDIISDPFAASSVSKECLKFIVGQNDVSFFVETMS